MIEPATRPSLSNEDSGYALRSDRNRRLWVRRTRRAADAETDAMDGQASRAKLWQEGHGNA